MTVDSVSLENFQDFLNSLEFDSPTHDAEVLLVTCIDFRFFHKVAEHIEAAGLSGKFDHVILAGAELGAVVDFPPEPKLHWQQFFLEHLELSKALHNIKKVLVLGHRDCGAYRKFKVLPNNPTLGEELEAHKHHADRLEALVKRFYPELQVQKYLLSLESIHSEPLRMQRLV